MELNKLNKMRLFQQITGWSVDKIRANKKQINALLNDESISFIEQELTEEQKTQARKNINAVSETIVQEINNTVNQQHRQINGYTDTRHEEVNELFTLSPFYLLYGKHSSSTSCTDKKDIQGYSTKVFEVIPGKTYRICAQVAKQKASVGGMYYSVFFVLSHSVNRLPGDYGTEPDFEIDDNIKKLIAKGNRLLYVHTVDTMVSSANLQLVDYIYNVPTVEELHEIDNDFNPLDTYRHVFLSIIDGPDIEAKCEEYIVEEHKGIEERVTNLEQKVGEDTLDELLSTLGTTLNGTFEKVWDDVNKKYTFTFTPGT